MTQNMNKDEMKKRLYKKTLIYIVIVLVCITGFGLLLSDLSKPTINLNEKTHITLEGFNGKGVLTVSLDADDNYGSFYETVRVAISKSEDLSNGDEVSISYWYDKKVAKENRIKVAVQELNYTVSGLHDPTIIYKDELFDGVIVEFTGVAPLVEAKVVCDDNKFDGLISYEIVEDQKYYDIGDTFNVRAVYDSEQLAEHFYVPEIESEQCIKEYRVIETDRYLINADEITDEMIETLCEDAGYLFTDANEYGMRIFCDAGLVPVYVNKKTTFVWGRPNYISSYLNVLKEENYGRTGTHVNDIKLCFDTYISQADGTTCGAEVVVMYQNIIIRADGSIDLNLKSGSIISADRRDSHIKSVVENSMDDEYESVKIN